MGAFSRPQARRLRALAQHLQTGDSPAAATEPQRRVAAVDDAYAEAVSAVHAMELFDMEAPCVQNFSQQKFDDDGYYSWEGLLTPAGSVAVKAACQRVQTIQDRDWLEADWEGIPERVWAEHGFRRPAEFLSAARKGECRGGSQLGGTPAADRLEDDPPRRGPHDVVNPPRMPVMSGFMPESFPAGYDGAMMGFLTHPQSKIATLCRFACCPSR